MTLTVFLIIIICYTMIYNIDLIMILQLSGVNKQLFVCKPHFPSQVLEPSRVLSVIHSFDCHSGEVASVGNNSVHQEGEEQGSKSPFSLLSEPIPPSSLLIQVHPVQFSLLPTFLFLPPPNFFWAISPSSLFCSTPLHQL